MPPVHPENFDILKYYINMSSVVLQNVEQGNCPIIAKLRKKCETYSSYCK